MLAKFLRWLFGADNETIYQFWLTKGDERSYHLYLPTNSISLHWYGFKRQCGLKLRLDETDDEVFNLWFALPFVVSVYFNIARANWLMRLLGMQWQEGMPLRRYRDLKREIGFSFIEGGVLIYPWVNTDDVGKDDRDAIWLDFKNILMGRAKYSEGERKIKHTVVTMPEGGYPATVELFQVEWKRPRWPWPKVAYRANVEIEGGIPIPGGDHDWDYDYDDDGIFSVTVHAKTVKDAVHKTYESAMRDRIRHAAANWQPAKGWPKHCLQTHTEA